MKPSRSAVPRDVRLRRLGIDSTGLSSDLPEDVQERSVRRARVFAWIVLIYALVDTIIDHTGAYLSEAGYPQRAHLWDLAGVGIISSLSVVAILLTRARKLPIDLRVWTGIAYLVVLAFAVAFTDSADGWWIDAEGRDHMLHGVPALTFVMLIFPVVIPMTARRAALVACLMAAMGPLALLTDASLLGLRTPPAQAFFQSAGLLVIPVSAVLAHIVHQLGLDVKRAREMGSYVLEEKLGEGGMGEVWRAKHRFLARPAAVKLIREGEMDAAKIERFEREAQATSLLKSPHTVEVYDFGVSKGGEVFYVMELLDGIDLEKLIADHGRQPPARVVGWLLQICHSLGEAHAAGIVHRDIKPANLFVCRYGPDYDFVKVLDFGLAGWAPTLQTDDDRLTADNKVMGTPAYMAPEVVTNKSAPDRRADIYALGCVAYFALTGRRVFEAKSPIEVILGHVDKSPVPPSELIGSELPEELERAVLSCLAKSPDDRPQDTRELAERLQSLPTWTDEDKQKWWESDAGHAASAPAPKAPLSQ